MVLRELFVTLGLDVDAASFAEGGAFIEIAKAGLGLVASAAASVGDAFYQNLKASGDWSHSLGASAAKTVAGFQKAADKADTIAEYVSAKIDGALAGAIGSMMPTILKLVDWWHDAVFTMTAYWRANVKLYVDPLVALFSQVRAIVTGQFIGPLQGAMGHLQDFVQSLRSAMGGATNAWQEHKGAILIGVAAVTAALIALKWEAIKSAVASFSAWMPLAIPFLAIGAAIGGLFLILDDLRVYSQGGISLFGRFKKSIEGWLSIGANDPEWLKSIKGWLSTTMAALSKKGAVDALFASVKAWIVKIGTAAWTFLLPVFTEIGDAISDMWGEAQNYDWAGLWDDIREDLIWIRDEIKGIDWKWIMEEISNISFRSWVSEIESFLGSLQHAYSTIMGIYETARRVLAFAESGGPVGILLARARGKVSSYDAVSEEIRQVKLRRDGSRWTLGGEYEGDGARRANMEYGRRLRRARRAGTDLPNYVETGVPTAYAQPQEPWSQTPSYAPAAARPGNVFNITQLPGEDGEGFAQRVAAIVDERNYAAYEDAGAAVPAAE